MKKNVKSLSAEDEKIWNSYIHNVTENENQYISSKIEYSKNLSDNLKAKSEKVRTTSTTVQLFYQKVLIDKKIYNKLKNGRLEPERRLDLHGLTYETAKTRVVAFIQKAYYEDKRLILIITGKGKNVKNEGYFSNENQRGILKRTLPQWLDSKAIRHLVLNVTPAHVSHGGNGAFYVYLKKNKS